MNLPRISVVTPVFNAVATIERTFRSIESQSYPNLQLIVMDGGSVDGTLDVIQRFQHLISHWESKPDRGAAHAINKGFDLADGDIWCWLNADDEFASGALWEVSRTFTERPEVDVLTGGCLRFYADGSRVQTGVPDRYLSAMALRNDIEQPSTFWRPSVHRRAGPLDESYRLAFDWEFWNRLKACGARYERTWTVLSHYHFSESNLTSRGAQKVVDEMNRVTAHYASASIAAAYRVLYRVCDLNGDYDVPPSQLRGLARLRFRAVRAVLKAIFGNDVIDNYNWNWASKQVRGVVWFK